MEARVKTESESPKAPGYPINKIRADFPILRQRVNGKPLAYLDNAASSQKPQSVVDKIAHFYLHHNSNVHRGVHWLSQKATEEYEAVRHKVRKFIHAPSTREIIFVKGTTEGVNLVAHSFGSTFQKGDEVIVSAMEHHSNIVPWQLVCRQREATLRVLPMNQKGELLIEELDTLLNEKTRMVAVAHISNALGTVNPVAEIARKAHDAGALVLVDGAQGVPHMALDVQALDCDFYAFSSHKMFGPTGVGVLYGRANVLESFPPYQGGGDMISSVSFEKTTYNELPHRFEAGTPNIAGVVGMGAAIDYLGGVGLDRIAAYEADLLEYLTAAVSSVEGVRLVGTAAEKAGVVSFLVDCAHPHDVGTVLDQEGVAVRTGHHCAQPVMDFFKIPATTRASVALYNTKEEIDRLVEALHRVREIFRSCR